MSEIALVKLLGGVRATIFMLLALIFLAAGGIQTFRLHLRTDTLDRMTAKADAAMAAASEAQRDLENERQAEVDRIHLAAEKGRNEAEKRYSSLQQHIAAGDYVLRDEFRCPAVPTSRAPAGHPAVAAAPAAAAWILPRPFVSATVSDAVDANRVLDDLYECRAILHAERVKQK